MQSLTTTELAKTPSFQTLEMSTITKANYHQSYIYQVHTIKTKLNLVFFALICFNFPKVELLRGGGSYFHEKNKFKIRTAVLTL